MSRVGSVVAVAALGMVLFGCSKEIKPREKGVWLVKGEQLVALSPITIDTDFTSEGFLLSYFTAEPKVGVANGDFYFILYGDYKPFGLRAFARRGDRYEEDTSKGALSEALQLGQMKDEDEMFKCRIMQILQPGIYVLDVQQKDGTQLRYCFQVQS